jgi:hypothetical protein
MKGRLEPEMLSFILSVFRNVETSCVDIVALLDYDAAWCCREDATFRDILSRTPSGVKKQECVVLCGAHVSG